MPPRSTEADTSRSEKRNRQACTECNKRKIRCDLVVGQLSCSTCRFHGLECRPHQRKRYRRVLGKSADRLNPPTVSSLQQYSQPLVPTADTQSATIMLDSGQQGLPGNPFSSIKGNNGSPSSSLSDNMAYVGRPEYLPGEFSIRATQHLSPQNSGTDADIAYLRLLGAFDLPPRALRDGLISNFFAYCSPWMPLVELKDLQTQPQNVTELPGQVGGPSLLLTQAVFLAGSRVQSSRPQVANSATFYNRARALFYAEFEPDPVKSIVALCLLQWYNPSGPERVSIHSGGFWLRTAVALAIQVGLHREPDPRWPDYKLRRRLFWTLFSRDCILTVAHGRPRSMNLGDSNICSPTVADFPQDDKNARLFVAYTDICSILGQCGQALNEGYFHSSRLELGRSLHRWIRDLPASLRLDNALSYDFEVRQLYLVYFTTVSVLYGPVKCGERAPVAPILAASCLARIFEDFLVRDHIRYLGTINIVHLRVATLSQLWCFNLSQLRDLTKSELAVIRSSFQELEKTWNSATRPLMILTHLVSTAMRGQQANQGLEDLDITAEQLSFFDMIPRELCPKWDPILGGDYGRTSKAQSATQSLSLTDLENLNVPSQRGETPTSAMLEPPSADVPPSPCSSLFQALHAPSEQQTQVYAADRLLTFDETDWMAVRDGLENNTGFCDGFDGAGFLQDWEGALF